jgi:hypothetical protein
MQMVKRSKDFRIQVLWVVSQLGQRGVDPRKHTRSRPMSLNIRWFSHGVLSRSMNEGTSTINARQSAAELRATVVPSRVIALSTRPRPAVS